jgi:hypothetical protein
VNKNKEDANQDEKEEEYREKRKVWRDRERTGLGR